MTKRKFDKNLINEISDMKLMMDKLQDKSYQNHPQLINEQQDTGCSPPCEPGEICCGVHSGGVLNQGGGWTYTCCDGVCDTMLGCQPFGSGDSGNSGTPPSGNDDDTECKSNNSGCRDSQYDNFSVTHTCDCSGNYWGPISAGKGDTSCCSNNDSSSSSGQSSGTGTSSTSAGGCFIKGTKVLMSSGEEKDISEVEIGDKVKSEKGESNVIGIDIHKGEYEIYSFNGGDFFTTSDHPFKTLEGWKALNPIKATRVHNVKSNILKETDSLITLKGEVELTQITKDENKHKVVYNLKLDNEHVYYVNGYLVHNAKNVEFGGGINPWDMGDDFDKVDASVRAPSTNTGKLVPSKLQRRLRNK